MRAMPPAAARALLKMGEGFPGWVDPYASAPKAKIETHGGASQEFYAQVHGCHIALVQIASRAQRKPVLA